MRKTSLFFTVVMLCLVSFMTVFADEGYKSEWNSSFAQMHVTQDGDSVTGAYDYSGGKLIGTLKGRVLEGWWSETDDKLMCGPGNNWSGPMVLRFSDDGKSFSGNYGKCERGESKHEGLPSDRQWNGTLLSGGILFGIRSEWDSNFHRMHVSQDGSSVTGAYDYSGGKLIGTLKGRVLEGWWSETDDRLMCGPGNNWSGPMVLRFSDDGKSFSGNYGKCERGESRHEGLPPDRKWDGKLVKGKMEFK